MIMFFLFIVTVIMLPCVTPTFPPRVDPVTYYTIKSINQTQTLVFNGTYIANITSMYIGDFLVPPENYRVNVSACKIPRTRDDYCRININSIFGLTPSNGLTAVSPCEPSPVGSGLTCRDDASLRQPAIYGANTTCSDSDSSNVCILLTCYYPTHPTWKCWQYGLDGSAPSGGAYINLPSLGLECGPDLYCGNQGRCVTVNQPDCPSQLTITMYPGTVPVGNHSLFISTEWDSVNASAVFENTYVVLPTPSFTSITPLSGFDRPVIPLPAPEEFMPILASPLAPFRIECDPPSNVFLARESDPLTRFACAFEVESENVTIVILPEMPALQTPTEMLLFYVYTVDGADVVFSASNIRFLVAPTPILFSLCPGEALAFTSNTIRIQGSHMTNLSLICLIDNSPVRISDISSAHIDCEYIPVNSTRGSVPLTVSVDNGKVYSNVLDVSILGSCETIKPNSVPIDNECACLPGFYDVGYACQLCGVDSYQSRTAQAACIPCDNTRTTRGLLGSNISSSCKCKDGFYESDGECIACPAGMLCTLGETTVLAGFWQKNEYEVVECISLADSCVGGAGVGDALCKQGYTGPQCLLCDNGYASAGGSLGTGCQKCESVGVNSVIFVVVVVTYVTMVYMLIRTTTTAREFKGAQEFAESQRQGTFSTVVKIFFNYLQILYIIGQSGAAWGNSTRVFFNVSPFSLSLNFTPISCLFGAGAGIGYFDRLVLVMCLPIIVAVLGAAWKLYTNKTYDTVLIILYIMHPAVSDYVMKALKCVHIQGSTSLVIETALDVSCESDVYYSYKAFCIFYLVFYVFGGPLVVSRFMYTNRETIETIVTRGIVPEGGINFLYFVNGYGIKTYMWELVVLFTKILMTMVLLIGDRVLQLCWMLLLLSVILVLTVKFSPYVVLQDNRSASLLICALMAVTMTGIHTVVTPVADAVTTNLFILMNILVLLYIFRGSRGRLSLLVVYARNRLKKIFKKEKEQAIVMHTRPVKQEPTIDVL
jgi:hypothetical protein